MWVLILVASVGFKMINTSQILGTGIQDNYNYKKTLICKITVHPYVGARLPRPYYCSEAMSEYLQMEVNNSSAPNLEESGNNNTSGWDKISLWGLQFLGGGIVSNLWFGMLIYSELQTENYFENRLGFICSRVIGDILFTAPVVWGIGKIAGQRGSLWKTAVGTGISSVLLTALCVSTIETDLPTVIRLSPLYLAAAGPVISAIVVYNLK